MVLAEGALARCLKTQEPPIKGPPAVLSRHSSKGMLIGLDFWPSKVVSANQNLSCRSPYFCRANNVYKLASLSYIVVKVIEDFIRTQPPYVHGVSGASFPARRGCEGR